MFTRRDKKGGPTPLHDAATPEIVALLLEVGADIDARAYYGATPTVIIPQGGFSP